MITRKNFFKLFLINNLLTFILLGFTIGFYKYINVSELENVKIVVSFILILINILLTTFLMTFCLLDNDLDFKAYSLINRYTTLFLNLGQVFILLTALDIKIPLISVFCLMIGFLFIIIGNYLPKIKTSKIVKSVSYKVNHDKRKFNLFKRVSAYVYIISGFLMLALSLINEVYILFIAFALILLSGVALQIYSIYLGNKEL